MILILIGLSWTGTTALATFTILGSIIFSQGSNTAEQVIGNIACIIFLIPFWIIGISLIVAGIKGIKHMKEYVNDYTNNPILYGKIYNTELSNTYYDSTYKIDIAIYNTVQRTVINTTEYLQERDKNRYKTGVYIQARKIGERYFIEKRLLEDEVPSDALIELKGIEIKDENGNKISKDTIVVNGVEYVRKN